MGFVGRHLQLAFRNGNGELFKQEITRIENENAFIPFLLPNPFYPSSSPGQTAKTILIPSSGTGFDLTTDIVTVKKSKVPIRFLGIGGKGIDDQAKSKNADRGKDPSAVHPVHL